MADESRIAELKKLIYALGIKNSLSGGKGLTAEEQDQLQKARQELALLTQSRK